MRLFTSERFQKEYAEFSRILNEIDDNETKKRLDNLLNSLVREVRAIDSKHEELLMSNKLPTAIEDSKTNLLETRKKIDRLIRDWKESVKQKQSS